MPSLGVIFDWDGVVVNSARMHVLSWDVLAAEEGKVLKLAPGLQIGSLGVKTEYVITDLAGWTRDPSEVSRIALRKEAIFREMVARQGIDSQPGVVDFILELHRLGVPMSIGSSAPRLNVEVGMDALGIRGQIAAVVSGDDVTHGKPAPDIFLKAAETIDLPPSQCVVFEDAPAGVKAARAGGMRVVGVLSAHTPEELPNADRYIRDFKELPAADFVSWAGSR